MQKTKTVYQFQLINEKHEAIYWHCGHGHDSLKAARECGRKNQPEIVQRIVNFKVPDGRAG